MAEQEWQGCEAPVQMLRYLVHLLNWGRVRERGLAMFVLACCRRVWGQLPNQKSRQALELAELFVDGLISSKRMAAAIRASCVEGGLRGNHASRAAYLTATFSVYNWGLTSSRTEAATDISMHTARVRGGVSEFRVQASLLRCIFGNPLRPLPILDTPLLTWNDGTLRRLAQQAYDDRLLPSGHLDPDRLAVLADALEDAQCPDPDLVAHLRGPGPHVRGCFVVDWLLGKS